MTNPSAKRRKTDKEPSITDVYNYIEKVKDGAVKDMEATRQDVKDLQDETKQLKKKNEQNKTEVTNLSNNLGRQFQEMKNKVTDLKNRVEELEAKLEDSQRQSGSQPVRTRRATGEVGIPNVVEFNDLESRVTELSGKWWDENGDEKVKCVMEKQLRGSSSKGASNEPLPPSFTEKQLKGRANCINLECFENSTHIKFQVEE